MADPTFPTDEDIIFAIHNVKAFASGVRGSLRARLSEVPAEEIEVLTINKAPTPLRYLSFFSARDVLYKGLFGYARGQRPLRLFLVREADEEEIPLADLFSRMNPSQKAIPSQAELYENLFRLGKNAAAKVYVIKADWADIEPKIADGINSWIRTPEGAKYSSMGNLLPIPKEEEEEVIEQLRKIIQSQRTKQGKAAYGFGDAEAVAGDEEQRRLRVDEAAGFVEEEEQRIDRAGVGQTIFEIMEGQPGGAAKVGIIKMHLGQEVFPGQPQDLLGDKPRGHMAGEGKYKKRHPRGPGRCPTCAKIARVLRVPGLDEKLVGLIVDDYIVTLSQKAR